MLKLIFVRYTFHLVLTWLYQTKFCNWMCW